MIFPVFRPELTERESPGAPAARLVGWYIPQGLASPSRASGGDRLIGPGLITLGLPFILAQSICLYAASGVSSSTMKDITNSAAEVLSDIPNIVLFLGGVVAMLSWAGMKLAAMLAASAA